MRTRDRRLENILRWLSKATILGVLLATTFSPFGQIFETPTVDAFFVCVSKTDPNKVFPSNPNALWGNGCPTDDEYDAVYSTESDRLATNEVVCNSLGSCLAQVVYIFTVGLGSAMAYVGAWVFSIATALTLSSTAYALTFLSEGWTIVRDMANMLFILILVYIAITIMLRADTADTMKKLAWVIFIALIINFSFFFVRVVIDTGNLLAVQFYNAIEAKPIGVTSQSAGLRGSVQANAAGFLGPNASTKDLTSSIMDGIGVQTILATKTFQEFQDDSSWYTELVALTFIYVALGAILFILAAAFFTVGIKFLFRTVVLWLVLIAAPVALIANTVQQGKKYYIQWQNALITHAFYPAVFLFVFYILTLFMKQLTEGGSVSVISSTFAELNTVQQGGLLYAVPLVAIIGIKLGLVIALLYIGLKVSETMGVYGAKLAQNITGKVWGGGIGALGFAGRRTFGWGGRTFAASTAGKNLATKGGVLGKTLWRGSERLGRSSYDLRAGRAGGVLKNTLATGTGIDVGASGGAGGYAATYDARVKRREAEAERLKPTQQQLEAAEKKKVIDTLPNADKVSLKRVADEFTQKLKDRKDGTVTQEEVKAARKAYEAEVDRLGIKQRLKDARKDAGSENAKKYAESIGRDRWKNLWGRLPTADQEAAHKIRDTKNEAGRILHMLRDVNVPDDGGTPTAPTPTNGAPGRPAPGGRRSRPPGTGPQPRGPFNFPQDDDGTIPPQPPPGRQPQQTASTSFAPARGTPQMGGAAGFEVPPNAFVGKPGMSEEEFRRGMTQLERTTAEQGKLTRAAIERGSKAGTAASRESLRTNKEGLGQIVRGLKTADRKGDVNARTQAEAIRAGTSSLTEKIGETSAQNRPASAKDVAEAVEKQRPEPPHPNTPSGTENKPPPTNQPSKPEEKK